MDDAMSCHSRKGTRRSEIPLTPQYTRGDKQHVARCADSVGGTGAENLLAGKIQFLALEENESFGKKIRNADDTDKANDVMIAQRQITA